MSSKSKISLLTFILVLVAVSVFFLYRYSQRISSNELAKKTPIAPISEQVVDDEEFLPAPLNISDQEATLMSVVEASSVKAPGTDLITQKGEVINPQGLAIKTDVAPTDNGAPTQSGPIEVSELADGVIKIDISSAGYSPNVFGVKAGQAVTIALTSLQGGHTLVFRDPMLQAVAIGVREGETRAMTFNAPLKKGEYEFYCNVGGDAFGHGSRGEVGKMIVE